MPPRGVPRADHAGSRQEFSAPPVKRAGGKRVVRAALMVMRLQTAGSRRRHFCWRIVAQEPADDSTRNPLWRSADVTRPGHPGTGPGWGTSGHGDSSRSRHQSFVDVHSQIGLQALPTSSARHLEQALDWRSILADLGAQAAGSAEMSTASGPEGRTICAKPGGPGSQRRCPGPHGDPSHL